MKIERGTRHCQEHIKRANHRKITGSKPARNQDTEPGTKMESNREVKEQTQTKEKDSENCMAACSGARFKIARAFSL